jgi:hypothetical protein
MRPYYNPSTKDEQVPEGQYFPFLANLAQNKLQSNLRVYFHTDSFKSISILSRRCAKE